MTGLPKGSVLDPMIHGRMLEMKANILADANIQEEWLHKSAHGFLNDDVAEYVKGFKKHKGEGIMGLIAFGEVMPDPVDHMSMITAWLTRNFIRSRVVTLDAFVEGDDEDLLSMSAVCIPNFFIGLPLADWKISGLVEALTQRKLAGKQTFLWADNEPQMRSKYGAGLMDMLLRDYAKVYP